MSRAVAHAPGTFCWIELGTTDAASARAFYTRLFGWDTADQPMGPEGVYTMLHRNGRNAGALYELTEDQRARHVPPHWLPYVAVADIDERVATAGRLGGTVLLEPFDVPDVGRIAVLQDPTGATLALFEAHQHPGADLVGEPGSLCWTELATRDTDRAGAFYTQLFGWGTQVQPMTTGPYTTFLRGEHPAGGMLQMTEQWGDAPPHWMPYFGVLDCDAAAARAKEHGGRIEVPPTDIPDVGRFSVILDPQGAAFSIIRLNAFG